MVGGKEIVFPLPLFLFIWQKESTAAFDVAIHPTGVIVCGFSFFYGVQ